MSTISSEDLVHNAHIVRDRVSQACQAAGRPADSALLVAVSKTKTVQDIQTLYDAGYRHFGENYFQELTEKAAVLPKDIHWHFIGHLQSSKASKLIREVPHLFCLQTLDSEKLAVKLQAALENQKELRNSSLQIMIQVRTSEEETKSGVLPEEAPVLASFVMANCPCLQVAGLMTIGAPGDFSCFDRLQHSRDLVAAQCGLKKEDLRLSMGMSADFEEAIRRGADIVRVGSTIFGERLYKK